jgi:polysaccharide export outer membrane protein
MPRSRLARWSPIQAVLLAGLVSCAGCQTMAPPLKPADIPRELAPADLPPYVINPPDVLMIDAVRLVPKPPYKLQTLDVLNIQVTGALPNAPIAGQFPIDTDGTVNLGPMYAPVKVEGLTVPQAKTAVYDYLVKVRMLNPVGLEVNVALGESRVLQQIRGPHLVGPDGTISMGIYGRIFVSGLTIPEAKEAVENYLGQVLAKPEVSVDVAGYNSMVYYIVTDGAGLGEAVTRQPIVGKQTVLDAMGNVSGLAAVSNKCAIFLVRPTEEGKRKCDEIYHVNWDAIVRRGDARTNYQVMPGDRIYVFADPLITFDTYLARFLAPLERIVGDIGLGNSTYRQFLVPVPKTSTNIVTTPVF